MSTLKSRSSDTSGYATNRLRFAKLGICVTALITSTGCFQECLTPFSGYRVIGSLVDAETGDSIEGAVLQIRLENEDGPIGLPAEAITRQDGSIGHRPGASSALPGLASSIVVTDSSSERCISFTLADFALASTGQLGAEEFPALTEPSNLDPPPQPDRAILSINLGDSAVEVTIDVTDTMIGNCPIEESPLNVSCRLNLGVIPVS
ncbi:MAG: hypothetical protein IH987_04535 [Planctomycetes bacterium]|nr:hypothetical protein [Planctomycetota bacterium]